MTTKASRATIALTLLVATSCDTQKALFGPDLAQQHSTVAPMCYGMEATIYPGSPGYGSIVANGAGGWTITGSSRSDIIVGAENDDVILGGDGADRICSGDGNDILIGGNGRDWMDGEAGEDVVSYAASPAGVSVNLGNGRGSGGTAELDRIAGVENVIGSDFADVLRGNVLANRLEGRDGADVLIGGDGNDILMGGLDADQLNGDGGDDTLDGGAGDDDLYGGADADALNGGADTDQANYRLSPGAVTVALASGGTGSDAAGDSYQFVENVMGSAFGDVLTGDGGPNRIDGRAGDDQVNGGAGEDMLTGGDGEDTLHGDGDNDVLLGKAGNDQVYGDAGNDRVFGHDGDDGIFGGDDDDDLRPGPGTNTVDGGAGNDYIDTASCTDTITNVESHNAAHCVTAGDATTTLVSAAHGSLTADGVSATTITVQVKDAAGNSLTLGGSDVIVTTTAGTLTDGATQNTTLAAIDQGDGTYTLTLTSSTSLETAALSATLDGDAVTDGASVDFIAGAVDHFVVTGTDGNPIGQQASGVAFNIKIVAQDANNHIADTFTGTVSLTANPGAVALGSTTAFTAGVFASKSVTITGGNDFAITASDGTHTGTSATFTVTANPNAVANEVGGSSAPNDAYHGVFASALTIADGSLDLLANDNLGYPAAAVTHFGAVQCNNGSGTLNGATGAVTANAAGASLDLSAISGCGAGSSLQVNANGTLTFTPSATYTGLFRFQYRIGNSGGTSDAQVTLAVGVRPSASNSTYGTTLLGNVPINTATSTNTLVSATGDNASFNVTGGTGGTGAVASNKTYSFTPNAAFTGAASFNYTTTNGFGTSAAGTVSLTVGTPVWFVNAGAGAGGDGRRNSPFNCLVGASCYNGSANVAGDRIHVASGSYANTGALVLKNDQRLLGQASTSDFATTSGLSWPADAGTVPASGGAAVNISSAAGNGITIGSNNVLRGIALGNAPGAALGGVNFGTLTVGTDVSIGTNGQALSLDNGTISGAFGTVTSTGGTNNIALSTVNSGAALPLNGPFIGATGTALSISGGNIPLTVTGNVTQSNNAALLSVTNGHTGTLTFQTGTVSATNGTGLQFDNADGTYNFSGTTTLNGGDAGIDIVNGSGGTFSFGAGTSITHNGTTANQAFFHSGSTAGVTYSGNMTKSAGTGWLVDIFNQGSGTITFQTGTLSAAGVGNGILLNNADGAVNFNGTTTLSGAARYRIGGGSSGAISFGSGASHASPVTNSAFEIVSGNGATNVTYAGTLTSTLNTHTKLTDIQGVSSGTVTLSGAISATGGAQGISVSNNSGGTIAFTNATTTLTTNANAAVSLSSNTGATINFTGGNLAMTTSSAAGFSATGGGTVNVTGTNNTVNANGGGTAVNITTTIGGSGVTLRSVNASAAGTNGIVLSNTGGSFEVTGDGASDVNNLTRGRTTAKSGGGTVNITSSGTISGRSGHGVSLTSTGPVTLRNMFVQGSGTSGDGLNASSVSGLTLDNVRITGHSSDHGIWGTAISTLTLDHSEIDNNATTSGVVEGPDIWNIRLLGVTGTSFVRNSNIHHGHENVFGIINTSGALNLSVANTNITDTGTTAGGGIAFMVAANGSSNVTLNMQNDSINRGRARGIQVGTETTASATFNLTVNSSQFRDNSIAIEAAHGSSGTFTYNVTNNNLQTNAVGSGQAININRLGSGSFNAFGLFSGTISGNIIGTAGVPNSGADAGSGIEVESNGSGGITRVAIVNNTIREVANHGIYVAAVDGNAGGTTPPLLEARIASNTISNMEAVIGLDGIHVLPGALNTDDVTMCVDIANNTATGVRNGLRVRPSGLPAAPSTVQLEGWDGVTAVATYFVNRPNTLAGGVAATSITAPPAPGGFVAVANCNTP